MGFQNGNIFLHKQTQEASICKTGFQEKNMLRTFYKEKWPIFISQVGVRPGFGEKVNNERLHRRN